MPNPCFCFLVSHKATSTIDGYRKAKGALGNSAAHNSAFKISLFWDVTPYSVVYIYQSVGETCLHLLGGSTFVPDLVAPQPVILGYTVTALRTLNLTFRSCLFNSVCRGAGIARHIWRTFFVVAHIHNFRCWLLVALSPDCCHASGHAHSLPS